VQRIRECQQLRGEATTRGARPAEQRRPRHTRKDEAAGFGIDGDRYGHVEGKPGRDRRQQRGLGGRAVAEPRDEPFTDRVDAVVEAGGARLHGYVS
jgi:hypothetical protein